MLLPILETSSLYVHVNRSNAVGNRNHGRRHLPGEVLEGTLVLEVEVVLDAVEVLDAEVEVLAGAEVEPGRH